MVDERMRSNECFQHCTLATERESSHENSAPVTPRWDYVGYFLCSTLPTFPSPVWCDGVYKEDVKCLVCLERMHSPTNSIVYTNSTIVGTNGEDVSRGN